MFAQTRKHLIVLLSTVLASFAIVLWNFRFLYLAGGDQSLYINLANIVPFITSFWDENFNYALGGQTISTFFLLPLSAPFYVLSHLFSPLVIQYLYFTCIFSGIFLLSYFYFYRYHFQHVLPSICASTLYFFNLFFFVSYINYNIHLTFLVLPLLLSLCHELMERNLKLTIIFILALSLFMPATFSNLPAVVPLFLMTAIYFLYLFLSSKKNLQEKGRIIGLSLGIGLITFCLNIWWIYPYVSSLLTNNIVEIVSTEVLNMFRTTSLYDSMRFLGGWAFNSYALNFSKGRYDDQYVNSPLFIISSFIPIVAAYAGMLFYKKSKHILFFFLLALISLTLAKGDVNPFGQWYTFIWKNVPGMIMFREPYTKFMIVYAFSLATLFGYFIRYLPKTLEKEIKWSLYAVIFIGITITSLPFLVGGFIPMRFSAGNIRSYLIEVPDYLINYKKYFDEKKLEFRIIAHPRLTQSYLWKSGFNIDDTVLKYYSQKPTLSDIQQRTHYKSNIDTLMQTMYQKSDRDLVLSTFLELMNVGYIVQENDKDWRWNKEVKKPSEMRSILAQLVKKGLISETQSFGHFTSENLSHIPTQAADVDATGLQLNESQKQELEQNVITELKDQPAIAVYKVNPFYFTLPVYTAEKTVLTSVPLDHIDEISFFPRQAIFFKHQLSPRIKIPLSSSSGSSTEFHKISSTKYKIVLHGVRQPLPLILSEAYHDGWKAYLSKNSNVKAQMSNVDQYHIFEGNEDDQATKQEVEEYRKEGIVSETGEEFISKSFNGTVQNDNLTTGPFFETWIPSKDIYTIADENHLMVNGYANSWIIDPSSLCSSSLCRKNSDGSYDMSLTIEFYPQRWFIGAVGGSVVVFLGIIILFVIYQRKKYEG